jgi:hypothetical protein
MYLIQRAIALLLGLVLLGAALVFASAILALGGALALVIGGWLWWRTRALRADTPRAGGAVIEGEYRVERDAPRIGDTD